MVHSTNWDRWLDNLAGHAGRWAERHWFAVLAAAWGGLLLLAAVAPLAWAAGLYPLATRLYWLFHFICHQEPARSLWIAGQPMAICARDVGLYGGLWVGLWIALWRRPSLPGWLVVMCVLPMALDGGTQLLGLRESTNVLRVVTGGLAGIPTAIYLGSMIIRQIAPSAHPLGSSPLLGEQTDGQ
ncbi:MAG: DUF2085 domain-containing protein [Anaerolineae bacterium]